MYIYQFSAQLTGRSTYKMSVFFSLWTHRIVRGALLFFVLSLMIGCATNPVTGKREMVLVSEASEIQIGRNNYLFTQQSQGGEYNIDPGLSSYVKSVGHRIAKVSDRPNLPYDFTVLNNSVPNAWALPGGKIAVNRGLLLEMGSESELAAVLSHEVVHAAARHSAKSMERGLLFQAGMIGVSLAASKSEYANIIVGASGLGLNLVNRRYGREAELESDLYGMKYMSRSGYDPAAAVDLQKTFVRLSEGRRSDWLSGLFSTHPPSRERVNANIATASTLPAGGIMDREKYQRQIAGIQKNKAAYEAYEKGVKALSDGNVNQAWKLLDEAIRIEPREAMFYGLQGDVKVKQKEYSQALIYYDKAVHRNNKFFRFLLQRGLVKEKLGDMKGAYEDLKKSNALLPTAHAHYTMGNIGLRSNQRDAAIKHFRIAASSSSEVGKAASTALVRLELPERPEAYIAVKKTLDQSGYVVVVIQNRSPVNVKNIAISVDYYSREGALREGPTAFFRNTVSPGKKAAVRTRLGPLKDSSDLKRIRLRIISAAIAE
jgi:predicted Zn-dependent protease